MTSEQEALLAGVVASPDDDLPRLVYADWLEEHGDADRAAFIRQQIAEWRDPTPWELSREPRPSRALLDRLRSDWLASVPAKARDGVWFERGFPNALRPGRSRAECRGLLARDVPELRTARRLIVPRWGRAGAGMFDELADAPGLARFAELRVDDWRVSGDQVAGLLRNPRLAGLEAFDCAASGARAVLTTPPPPRLRRLRVEGSGPTADTVRAADVAQSALLMGLTDLAFLAYSAWGVTQAVCRGTGPRGLVRLAVPASTRVAVEWFDLPHLRRLVVHLGQVRGGTPVEEVADTLTRSAGLVGLEALSLVGSPIGLVSFMRLAESDALARVRRLDAPVDGFPDTLAEYLLAAEAPLRFDKLCVGREWVASPHADKLRERYGGRLQLHTDAELEPTLRRLGRW